MTRLKIISNGMPCETYVEDELGKRLDGIVSIEWKIGMDRVATAKIEFVNVSIEASAESVDTTNDQP